MQIEVDANSRCASKKNTNAVLLEGGILMPPASEEVFFLDMLYACLPWATGNTWAETESSQSDRQFRYVKMLALEMWMLAQISDCLWDSSIWMGEQ